MVVLGFAEHVLDLPAVSEVGTSAGAAEDIDGDRLCLFRGVEVLLLQLEVEDLKELGVTEVFEAESILDGEATRETWVDILGVQGQSRHLIRE